jgi:hypothetical protein
MDKTTILFMDDRVVFGESWCNKQAATNKLHEIMNEFNLKM